MIVALNLESDYYGLRRVEGGGRKENTVRKKENYCTLSQDSGVNVVYNNVQNYV